MDMNKSVKVTYKDGAFHPDTPCDLPEGFVTTITLTSLPPPLTDPEERRKSMQRLVERMKRKQITGDPPKFTREDLYDRY